MIFVLASLLTNPLDCYCQLVSWLGGGRNGTPAPTVLEFSIVSININIPLSRILSYILELLLNRKREKRVFVESSDIASQTAIRRWFHSRSHFLSVATFTWPNLNKCFKSETWCEWIGWEQRVKIKKKKKTEEEKDRGKKRHRVRHDRMAISQSNSNRMRI